MLIPKVEKRIEQYLDVLERRAYRRTGELDFEMFETGETFRTPPGDGAGARWRPVKAPAPWGGPWRCAWFRASYTSPRTERPLFLSVLPNADSLAFIDGKAAGAFNLFHKKLRVPGDGEGHTLHVEAYAGHPYAGCGPFEVNNDDGEAGAVIVTIGKTLPAFPNTFEGGFLLERLEQTFGLYYDVRALFDTALTLGEDSLRKARVLKGLYDALTCEVSLMAEGEELEAQAAKARARIAPLLASRNGDTVPEVFLAGHAHIDHAWLWPIAETERKIARTYANMARFAREYPEFVFIQSQPCQLEIVKREYPDVFAAVKEAYRNGNWEPNGGMWVEADCNIPSGESLVRQFLVGKAANRELLGDAGDGGGAGGGGRGGGGGRRLKLEADTLWLPDVFGYAAALPQILAGCRIKYFVTSKIGWNDTTRFPYDTFLWRGIDGTGVKTHFVSSQFAGYNGRVKAEELAKVWEAVQHKELQSGFIRSVGEGDGGGGTLRADLELARRFRDLEGAPRAAWSPVSAALERIFAGIPEEDLPEWQGELYLELHRGTYTTQARTKRNNRRLEFSLMGTEFLAAMAANAAMAATAAMAAQGRGGAAYPREELLRCWKETLTNQFHDIIPGSCIGRVYTEAEAQAAAALERLAALRAASAKALFGGAAPGGAGDRASLPGAAPAPSAPAPAALILVNPLSWERRSQVTLPAALLDSLAPDGGPVTALRPAGDGAASAARALPVERYTGLDGAEEALFTPALPSMGWRSFVPASASGNGDGAAPAGAAPQAPGAAPPAPRSPLPAPTTLPPAPFRYDGATLHTPFYRVIFDSEGRVTSLRLKDGSGGEGREFTAPGGALNAFVLAEDVPVFWDAWDIDSDWTRRVIPSAAPLESAQVINSGPITFRLRQTRRLGAASTLKQDIIFYAGSPRIDFDTLVDWRERRRLLKVQFDTPLAARSIRCEVQYGHIFRGVKANLPQDRARFEICAHKWVSLEEEGAGLALLNDSKYGHDVQGGRLRLSLLRAPLAPDPEADQGVQRFTYALLPFTGPFAAAGVTAAAYELNAPPFVFNLDNADNAAAAPSFSFVTINTDHVIAECVKQAEDGDGLVLRLYECMGGPCRASLSFAAPLESAAGTDMLEDNPRPLPFTGAILPLSFRPFEIKTLRVKVMAG